MSTTENVLQDEKQEEQVQITHVPYVEPHEEGREDMEKALADQRAKILAGLGMKEISIETQDGRKVITTVPLDRTEPTKEAENLKNTEVDRGETKSVITRTSSTIDRHEES